MDALIRGDSNIALVNAARQAARQKAEMLAKHAEIGNIRQIDEAAKDFEANFLSEMLKPIFEEVHKSNDLFGGGKGEEIFNGMMVQEYGKIMADRGGIGIADYVKAELIKIQEAQGTGTKTATGSKKEME